MTLFDGKPLEEEEVARLVVCECDHIRGAHRELGYTCTICSACESFTPKSDDARRQRFDA